MADEIEIISKIEVSYNKDLYKVVDLLNRTLKKDDLMFGLALDEKDEQVAIFTIYRT
ncbi:YpmA family protein [Bacillaceae bacterium W0354]